MLSVAACSPHTQAQDACQVSGQFRQLHGSHHCVATHTPLIAGLTAAGRGHNFCCADFLVLHSTRE